MVGVVGRHVGDQFAQHPSDGTEDASVGEAQFLGQDSVDPPVEVVEVGVGRIDGDALLEEAQGQATGGRGRRDAFDCAEDERMVGDDEVGMERHRFVDNGGGDIDGAKHA